RFATDEEAARMPTSSRACPQYDLPKECGVSRAREKHWARLLYHTEYNLSWKSPKYFKDTRWLVFPFDTDNIEFAGGKAVFDGLPGGFTDNDRSPILLRGTFQARAKIDFTTHDCIGEAQI